MSTLSHKNTHTQEAQSEISARKVMFESGYAKAVMEQTLFLSSTWPGSVSRCDVLGRAYLILYRAAKLLDY